MNILQRGKQFFLALGAKVTAADEAFFTHWLPERQARELFLSQTAPDQKHALRVAYTAQQLARGKTLDLPLLLRAALLHDTGRTAADMSTMGKVFAVILTKVFSASWLKRKALKHRHKFLWHIIYIYYFHPQIGAEKLRQAGLLQEAELVAGHHLPAAKNEPPELTILRQADNLN